MRPGRLDLPGERRLLERREGVDRPLARDQLLGPAPGPVGAQLPGAAVVGKHHLDDLGKPRALLIVQDRSPPRSLARCQTIGTSLVKAQNPVAHDLQRHAGNLRRFATAPAVQDQCNSQQTPDLIGIATSSRKPMQIRRCVVRSNPNRCRHRKPPCACNVESDFHPLGNP